MSIRLNVIVEGQTEETFVKQILRPHLANFSVWVYARSVLTSRRGRIKHRGGIGNYAKARNDICRWLAEDQNRDARFTTMIDLYRLPVDFPSYADAARTSNPYERVGILENALGQDIPDSRFIPNLQLHEFEALLMVDIVRLGLLYDGHDAAIGRLAAEIAQFRSPELINDGDETAPSKRITAAIPEYRKALAGPIVAEGIGLKSICSKCPHFKDWLLRLEQLV